MRAILPHGAVQPYTLFLAKGLGSASYPSWPSQGAKTVNTLQNGEKEIPEKTVSHGVSRRFVLGFTPASRFSHAPVPAPLRHASRPGHPAARPAVAAANPHAYPLSAA